MPKIQMRRDTAANWKSVNPILLSGEWALETDTKKMKIGDGSTAYNALPYSTAEDSDEWIKPDDWIDIRSGALPNSVYFLVGHSADYSQYPKFAVIATVSSGTYDVYVDGVKFATTASGTATELNWQTLNLATGYDVTYPSALKTHVVRVTPTNSASTFTYCRSNPISGQLELGVLWINFNVDYAISLYATLGAGSLGSQTKRSRIAEAVTSSTGIIKATAGGMAFFTGTSLKYIYPLDLGSQSVSFATAFVGCNNLKTVTFQNGKITGNYVFHQATGIKKINLINSKALVNADNTSMFNECSSLEQMPPLEITSSNTLMASFLTQAKNLQNTILDVSQATGTKKIGICGTSTARIDGLKGLTVSNEAPFDNATSPQLDVSYTGLNKAALVNLFNSMPYNVGYEKVGSPTITDGVFSTSSSSDYIRSTDLSVPVDLRYDTLEIIEKINIGSTVDTNIGYMLLTGLGSINSGAGKVFRAGFGTSSGFCTGSTVIQANTTYTVKAIYGNSKVALYLAVGTGDFALENEESVTSDFEKTFSRITLGRNSSSQWLQAGNSIDLNNTTVKLNGVTVFENKEYMAKTCSVVGCTGTADLTESDKELATGKGWALTVA